MVDVHQLSRRDARRIAVRAQLLSADRSTDVVDTVGRLTLVQLDPTNAVAPSADLVLWSRLGSAYDPQELLDAFDQQRLVDLGGVARVAEDIRLFRAEMEQWPGAGELKDWQRRMIGWIEANEECRRDILERLRGDGPLPASELPDSCVVPWPSSGWNNNRNMRMMLDLLVQRGEVAVAGREGRERRWDLAERIYPDVPAVPYDEALRLRDEGRLRGLGIARARAPKMPGEPHGVGEAGSRRSSTGSRPVAGRSGPAGSTVRGSHGAALAVRPAGLRPQAPRRGLRVRLRARDVQARDPTDLGLLRAAGAPWRSAGRQARRSRRPGGPGCSRLRRSTRTRRSRPR